MRTAPTGRRVTAAGFPGGTQNRPDPNPGASNRTATECPAGTPATVNAPSAAARSGNGSQNQSGASRDALGRGPNQVSGAGASAAGASFSPATGFPPESVTRPDSSALSSSSIVGGWRPVSERTPEPPRPSGPRARTKTPRVRSVVFGNRAIPAASVVARMAAPGFRSPEAGEVYGMRLTLAPATGLPRWVTG